MIRRLLILSILIAACAPNIAPSVDIAQLQRQPSDGQPALVTIKDPAAIRSLTAVLTEADGWWEPITRPTPQEVVLVLNADDEVIQRWTFAGGYTEVIQPDGDRDVLKLTEAEQARVKQLLRAPAPPPITNPSATPL